jgi:phenylacetate-coenzyme A ligase PaaK-like adenylate-forming protein
VRENELLVEVVHPASGEPVAPGETGEVVFSTLTRRGMPLIRYRTGDLSRLLPGTCACRSPLLRLERIHGRIDAGIDLDDERLTMAALDEVLFPFARVIDFSATYRPGPPPALHVDVACLHDDGTLEALYAAVAGIPGLAQAIDRGLRLALAVNGDGRLVSRVGKRRIALDNAA